MIKCNNYDKCVKMLQMWLPIAQGNKYDKGDKDEKGDKGHNGDKGEKGDTVWLRWQSVTTVTKCEKGDRAWQI